MGEIFKVKLTSTNFNSWYPLFEAYILSKGYKKHLEYDTFEAWWTASHPPTDREQRFDRLFTAVKNRALNAGEDESHRDTWYQELEDKYKDVLQAKTTKASKKLEWIEEEEKIRGCFTQSVESILWPCFKTATNTQEIIKCLRAETLQDKPGTFMSYLQQFFNLKLNESEPLMTYVSKMIAIVDKIEELGKSPTWEEIIVYRIISAMPPRAAVIQQQICQLQRDKMKISTIKEYFQAEDARLNSTSDKVAPKSKPEGAKMASDQAHQPRTCAKKGCNNRIPRNKPGNVRYCAKCTSDYLAAKSKNRNNNNSNNNDNAPKRDNNSNSNNNHNNFNNNNNNNNNSDNKQKASVMKMMMASTINRPKHDHTWYVDSGCTSHFMNDDQHMIDKIADNTSIEVATGDTVNATCRGTININTNNNSLIMNDVIHSPNMTNNLFSVSKCTSLDPNRYVIFNRDTVEVFEGELIKNGDTIINGAIDHTGLYAIHDFETAHEPKDEPTNQIALSSKLAVKTLAELHEIFGHLSKPQILAIAEYSTEFKIADPDADLECLACDAGKMKRKKFNDLMPDRAENAGEVVYSDICGKISPKTIFGEKYLITFIDEKSGYIEVFLAKKKSEAINRFKEVRAKFNNHTSSRVKMFVTDGGGEYTSREFDAYLASKGIMHVLAPPNTPQRVGKSERLNRVLFDHARAMLKARRIPRRFWGFAILYAVFMRNLAIYPGSDKSRYELFYGKKPSYKHCLPFGCPISYSNVDRQPAKLDDRSFKGMFLGFNEINYTYIVLNLETNEIAETRDLRAHSNFTIDFDNNDWDQALETTNENNWYEGEESDPPTRAFSNLDPLDESTINRSSPIFNDYSNNNNNPINNPNANNRPVDQQQQADEDIMGNPINNAQHPAPDQRPPAPILNQPLDPQPRDQQLVPINRSTRSQSLNRNLNAEKPANRTRSKTGTFALSAKNVEQILNLADIETPNSYNEAMKSPQSNRWRQAIDDEINSLNELNTFKVVPRTQGIKTIKMRLVFKAKTDDQNRISRFKARLVAQGFRQQEGVDYFETFSPVLRAESLRFLISVAAQNNLEIHNLDVKNAFLQADLNEDIYVEIPPFMNNFGVDRATHVLKLLKSIYGLKQAGRVWNEKFTREILNLGFKISDADPCIFVHTTIPNLHLGIFVDDCFVVGTPEKVAETKNKLCQIFPMHDLGKLNYALGIKIEQSKDCITLCQDAYVERLLEKFNMVDCKPTATPLPLKAQKEEDNNEPFEDINLYQQLVGSLIYLSNITRPDLAYAVSHLARAMSNPTMNNWIHAKRVLRYLKGTPNLALKYSKNSTDAIFGYSDSSYAEELDRKSVGGYIFIQAGAAITWRSSRQPIVAQSSAEAEYIALADAAKEAVWLRKMQKDFNIALTQPTIIYEDNQSAIKLSKNPIHSRRSKHIDVMYHATREYAKNGIIAIEYLPTENMVADALTKPLAHVLHDKFRAGMGLVQLQ